MNLRFDRIDASLAAADHALTLREQPTHIDANPTIAAARRTRARAQRAAQAADRHLAKVLAEQCNGHHEPIEHRDGTLWCLACRRRPDGVLIPRKNR